MLVKAIARGWDGKQVRAPGEVFEMSFPEPKKGNDLPQITADGKILPSNAGKKEPSRTTANWFEPIDKKAKAGGGDLV